MSQLRLTILVSVSCMLGACGGGPETCDEPKFYESAVLQDRVDVPEDLDELDRGREIDIPEPSAAPQAEDAGCVEKPPSLRTSKS